MSVYKMIDYPDTNVCVYEGISADNVSVYVEPCHVIYVTYLINNLGLFSKIYIFITPRLRFLVK